MDTMTSYKKEYTPKEGPPVKPIKRQDARKVQGKFEGDPTYRCKSKLKCMKNYRFCVMNTGTPNRSYSIDIHYSFRLK